MLRIFLFSQKQNVWAFIYYHLRRDHESSDYRKLAINKWICPKKFWLLKILYSSKDIFLATLLNIKGKSSKTVPNEIYTYAT